MKLILVITAIIQACILYLLVGFGVNALCAKMSGYENWKEWYREEDGNYILSLIFWPCIAVLIVVLAPIDFIRKVLDDLIGDGERCEDVCKHAPPEKGKWPCEDCDMRWHDRAEPPTENEKICENCYWVKWYRGDLYCTHVGLKTKANSTCRSWKPKEESNV